MNENNEQSGQEELNVWIKKQLDGAVKKLMKQGGIDGLLVEAKPAWVLPFHILIGQIRPQGQASEFSWCICGEVPTDFLHSDIANTPREALRHFSMKWQLAAARNLETNPKPATQASGESEQNDLVSALANHAEDIYTLVEDDRLWMKQ